MNNLDGIEKPGDSEFCGTVRIGEHILVAGVEFMLVSIHKDLNEFPRIVFRPASEVYAEIEEAKRNHLRV